MTDSERLDKLERLENKLRKRYWFGVGMAGGIIASPTKDRLIANSRDGCLVSRSLREVIDAAPEPKGRRL